MSKILIGADIGGSHISCMAVNPVDHSIIKELVVRKEVNSQADAGAILSAWSSALSELIGMIGLGNLAGIGFAMPGPFDYPGGIAWFKGVKKFDSLYGINIRQELKQRLNLSESVPVRFINDATAFAIGEAWIGKAAGFKRSMAITLGTGFGSAFISEGIPVISGDEVPQDGCVWHIPYGKSIANDYFSTSWFVDRFKDLTDKKISGVKEIIDELCNRTVLHPESKIENRKSSIKHPLSSIQHPVSSIFREFGTNLGTFLAPWLNIFQAGCLVIGGNIANGISYFEGPLKTALSGGNCNILVFISELGELAAIAGAARLCDDDFYKEIPKY